MNDMYCMIQIISDGERKRSCCFRQGGNRREERRGWLEM